MAEPRDASPHAPSVSRVARLSAMAETSTEQGRDYLQKRIALLARVLFGVLICYTATLTIGRQLYPEVRTASDGILNALMGVVTLMEGAIWWIARGKTRSAALVKALDYGSVVDPCVLLGVAIYMMRGQPVTTFFGFFGALFVVLARALIVPSSGRRTAWISTLTIAPAFAAHGVIVAYAPSTLLLPGGMQLMLLAVWSAVAIGLAALGSSVIYGLREKVREAKQLGQYTLHEKIGEGGMGSVYRASHAMLRRPTAIKLLPLAKAGAAQAERFEREVQSTAELTHPNTVAIFDYGRSPDGVFYYAMEYLDGVDLQTLVDHHGPQPIGRVIHILHQICGALSEAHDRHLVHRDIKPANVFLCQRGGMDDVVKVLDFGLVKNVSEGDAGLTDVNMVAGTPAFIAPEAITAPDDVGPAADLYALGAVGFFLLTGTHVFDGATVVEVCTHHVHTAPDVPSERLGAPLPQALDELILDCLAKKPDARPGRAADIRTRLEALRAEHGWRPEDAAAWWDAHDGETGAPLSRRRPAAGATGDTAFAATMEVDLRKRLG